MLKYVCDDCGKDSESNWMEYRGEISNSAEERSNEILVRIKSLEWDKTKKTKIIQKNEVKKAYIKNDHKDTKIKVKSRK